MSRLVILIAVILVAWLLVRWFVRTPPKQVITTAKRAGLLLALLVLAFLALTGRLNWIFVIGAAALPFLRRGLTLLRFLPMVRGLLGGAAGQAGGAFGQQRSPFSTLETRFLRVSLDIRTGNLDGEILDGAFEGQFLSKLTLDELLRLLQECSTDPRSAALLAAYLDRHHSGWRTQTDSGGPRETPPEHGMSAAEACDILGVEAKASKAEIIQAHRRLIHKLHPDRGGSTYLATKINQAKDYLLKHQNAP
ncbi:MAG TPA: molecular chaperone DnaJ [Gammaproteobacteria bacterium]|nr:molecular chaperone DnaJ [Gammaproteobacteria bacterium]